MRTEPVERSVRDPRQAMAERKRLIGLIHTSVKNAEPHALDMLDVGDFAPR
jgi:hypothetical protein